MNGQKETKNLSQGPMKVEAAKFELPFGAEHISRTINLPYGYGKDRIIAIVRDPWWVFVYWEITPEKERTLREEIEREGQHFERSVLRIYDVTGMSDFRGPIQASYFEINLKDMAKNWYVDVGGPGRSWCVEIGMLTREGAFYTLLRSNIVRTPRFGMSDIFDASWMLSEEEYWWLFGASGGFDVGKSSLEMKELFKRQLQEWISSGGMITLGSHMMQQRR
jgi:hypothetical protein